MENKRDYHICTWKTPWKEEIKLPTQHPEAFAIETNYIYCDETYTVWFCPVCQRKFMELVPR